ncbi:MAG: GNAT family N-acetyltransferase [Segniliparus sp.]|uniref:GNAT family N-acetyltransferase n=1 Tax=Segniliparus sp. TaxID=2804064 RepID=UPI003F2B829C
MTRPRPGLPRHIAPGPAWVPAPPAPKLEAPFRVRPADPDTDAPLVAAWMRQPELVRGWEQDWPDERWREQLKAQADGSYSLPCIVESDGKPCMYLEIYRAAQDSIGDRYEAGPFDLGMHVAIADPAMTGKGLMTSLLPRLVASLLELDPRCERVMFDPDHRNAGARRVLEHAGCAFLGEHQMANRRMALYALARAADRERHPIG